MSPTTAPLEGSPTNAQVLGPYRLLRLIGTGGMGEVFLAERTGPNGYAKRVAVKRLLRAKQLDEDARRGFVNEARIASELSHPNLIEVFEFDEIDGELVLSMEYLPGTNLRDLLTALASAPQRLSPRVVSYICSEALRGLHHAHELKSPEGAWLGLVHRDLSPENILLGAAGEVKVSDFGIAKLVNTATPTTAIIRGKPAYASPEHLRGQPVTRLADVYSMGAVLQELLRFITTTGREGPADAQLPGLHEVMAKALAPRPEDRFETADAMARALVATSTEATNPAVELAALVREALSHAVTVPVQPSAPAAGPTKSPRGWRARFWILGAAAMVLAGAIFGVVVLRTRTEPQTVEPVRAEPVAPSPPLLPSPPPTPAPPVIAGQTAKRPPPAKPAKASVSFLVYPWAEVFLDGKLLGTTPMPAQQVEPGSHEFLFRNPRLGTEQKRLVKVRAGEKATLKVNLERP
jgi:tRNA A-37 threonylcarbamoyl transferase component Bud32